MTDTPEKKIVTREGEQKLGDTVLSLEERKAAEAIRAAVPESSFEKNRISANNDFNKIMLQQIDQHFIMHHDQDKNKSETLRNKESTQKFYDHMIYDIGSHYLLKSKTSTFQEDKPLLDLVLYFLKLKNPDLYNNPQSTFARDFEVRPYRTLEQYFKTEYSGTSVYQEKLKPEIQTGLTGSQKDAILAQNTGLENTGLSLWKVINETQELDGSTTFATKQSEPIKQEFYMSKNTPEDNLPTIQNQLKKIQTQLDLLKTNNLVDQNSIKVVIQSSASFMTYDGEFGDNNGLAEARAKTAEKTVLNGGVDIKPENISKQWSVNGPGYPPTQELLDKFLPGQGITVANYQRHLDVIEAAIYRRYQYVNVSLEYQEKQPEPRYTVQKESDIKKEIEAMYTWGTTDFVVEKGGKYFHLQLSHNIQSNAQRDRFPITPATFNSYVKKVGANTEVNKNTVNKNDYHSKRPVILIPSDQYDFITEKFIKKGNKPVDYTDKWLDQEVNKMLVLVEDEKKKPNPNYSGLKFN